MESFLMFTDDTDGVLIEYYANYGIAQNSDGKVKRTLFVKVVAKDSNLSEGLINRLKLKSIERFCDLHDHCLVPMQTSSVNSKQLYRPLINVKGGFKLYPELILI